MKYMGSKSRIARHIVPIIQSYIDENRISAYIEPFVGGANVIDKIKSEYRVGADINKYLIALFRHIQAGGRYRIKYRGKSTPPSVRIKARLNAGMSVASVFLLRTMENFSEDTPER